MKKILFFLIVALGINLAGYSQDDKTKVKKTTTVGQKVHNTFSKHKKFKGYKKKHKHNGVTHKRKVNLQKNEVKVKND